MREGVGGSREGASLAKKAGLKSTPFGLSVGQGLTSGQVNVGSAGNEHRPTFASRHIVKLEGKAKVGESSQAVPYLPRPIVGT